MHNRIEGNSIGINRTGDAAISNDIGIEIVVFASDNTIGGSTAGHGNTIAGNISSGIELNGSSSNSVIGNSIGLLSSGTPLPNGTGMTIINASLNTIGSDSWSGRNTISGNAQVGIHITGAGAFGNLVQSNAIGTDSSGTIARPNAVGVLVDGGAHDNQIGTSTARRNLISGNTTAGVRLAGTATIANIIAGNTIGLGLNGETIGNGYGVIDDGTGTGNPLQSNRLGGNLATERNTISANLSAGIHTFGSNAGLRVEGNIVGLDINGTVDRGNQGSGVIVDSANTTIIHNTISGNAADGVVITGNAAQITGNRIGLDHSGAFAIGNDAHGIVIDALASLTFIDDNTIAGNSAGIRDAGSQSTITDNRIGTNQSGLKMIGNRRGSGTATDGHFGILEIGSQAQIGDVSSGNVIVGHDIGIRLRDAEQAIVINNHIGTDALEVAAMPNTIGMELSGTSSGNVIQSNGISNSLSSGLHLLGGTSNHNQFLANRYVGNLGSAIDAGTDGGSTLNDADDSDGLLNFPVLEYADILNDALVVRGFVGSGRSVELYVSTPTVNGIGQGATSLGVFTEGSASDSDLGSGDYGPDMRGVPVGSASGNRFEFTIPLSTLPPALRYGSLVTAVALGSTSEFGNVVPIGDPATALAPKVFLPLGVSLVQGESLRVQGSFRDDDSTAWTLSVDYGDGTGPQPLAFASDHTFLLEHTYQNVSGVPYQVIVTAVDNSNRVGVGVMGVSVGNDPPQPTFNSFEFTPIISEGQAVTLKGAFSDSGANDSHTISIDWGDGSSPTIIPLPVGAREFTSLHQYPDDGASGSASEFYRIRITMSDNLGGFSSTPDGLYIVEVKNELPTVPVLTAPNSLIENQLFGLSGAFDDVGLLDTHTVSIDWGDGSPRETLSTSQLLSNPATRAFSVLHRFLDEPGDGKAGYNVTVEVTDDDQPLSPVRMTKFIEVANETPSVVNIALGSTTIHEGETTSVTVELDDSGPKDSHQVVIDWGDGSEPKIVDLAPGVFVVPTVFHRYDDEPPVGSFYTMQIRLRDNDMPPGVFVTDSRQVTVQNSAPTITQLKLFTRTVSGGTWSEHTSLANIVEGDEVKITGTYSDPGKHDLVAGSVQWSTGVTTAAEVNRSSGTFEAQFRYTDDFPIGTAIDDESIVVTLLDGDGGTTSSSQSIRVSNSAPTVEIVPEIITNPQLIPFTARVSDLGTEPISIQWQASSGSTVIQSGSGTTFSLDRSLFGTGPIHLSVTVADDDGGTATLSTGVIIGSSNADTITINAGSFITAGVDTLVVLGLGGTDILDASSVPAPYRVILDGGDGQDFLYGGAGNDTFILRAGDDSANVDAVHYPTPVTSLPIPLIAPNYAGNDKYYLKPNSTLTVVDLEGSNSLDYSIAAFGVEFSLAQANASVLTAQSVAPGDHYVAAIGTFNELVGSPFADRLTGASGASTFGGDGADRLKAISGTVNARFIGGHDADVFETAGTGLSGISFEGDDGADTFTNLGELSGGIIFSGGADADLFSNLGTIFSEISFEGDDGADIFSNELGGILSSISFEGDAGSDRFVNRGTILLASVPSRVHGDDGADIFENYGSLTNVIFTGGADADLFVNELSGILGSISFEGDDGADIFTNDGHLLTGVIFTGGADADLFTNTGSGLVDQILFEGDDGADIFTNSLGGTILGLSFEGDDGADIFVNSGDLGSILTPVIFTGGADADMFINEATGILFSLSFEGDDGADIFVNSGSIDGNLFGGIIFTGGTDGDRVSNMSGGRITGLVFKGDDGADIFTNTDGGLLTEISFEGDDGADIFTNLGELTGTIIFTGGADADLFENAAGGLAGSISFEGDDGADIFTNAGDLFGGVIFNGGADDDGFANLGSGFVSRIAFHGDDGADIFTNLGTLSGDLLGGISFEGDDGADNFINEGTISGILGTVIFTGGADADLFVNNDLGIINAISFEGDDGADTFTNTGNILTEILFTGGADADRLLNFDSHIERIRFIGYVGPSSAPTTLDDSADLFANYGDFITSISFEGDDGADIFHNTGDWIGSIDFNGDDGADIFLSTGSDLVTISFEGDDGADVFGVTGTNLGSISFEGDANDVGNDTFVNRSTPSATGPATLRFVGFGGLDGLRNDGAGWNISFLGGADEDAFQNNASSGFGLFFKGDDGADVFENNGELISSISFEGDQGSDVFANGGDWVSGVTFDGGQGNDAFVNSGLNGSRFTFRGDDGADVFSNVGSFLSEISFEGDQGNDRVSNFGIELSHFQFIGGTGSDSFFNRESATSSHNIEFQSGIDDDGSDLFVNWASQLSNVTFDGGANSDEFRNFGADAALISILGGSGNDVALNAGYRLQQFTFDGGDGDDALEQSGNEADNVLFSGENGQDTLIIRGDYDAQLTFHGGADTDFLTNYGSHAASLTFYGDDGDDRFQNNGDWIGSIVFVGGTGADALQNNGDRVTTISVDGASGSDSVFNNGNDIGSILFTGSSGADSLIQSGSRVTSVSFWGEEDADVFRADKVIGTAFFSGGDGDDAMLWNGTNASLGTGSSIQLQMLGGSGNDVLIFRGLATQFNFQGASGNDRVVVSGSSSGADLNGGDGDDRFEFLTSPAGSFTITEGYAGPLDTSRDVLDFSAFNGPVSIDLQLVTPQLQVGGLSLTLSDSNGIETVIGSSGADTILGNDRDNYLAGARFFYPSNAQSNPTAPTTLRPTQWVLLDFDSYTEPVVGEHVYNAAERTAILGRLRSSFAALNTAGLRVEFTMNSAELPQGIDFVTIRFNDTPLTGRPGGEASEVDFGNGNYGGFARIQVSGLLGGIEVPINSVESFAETLPEDGDVTIGQDKPAATSENIIALSAKMTAHELAHLLGVRHYDSFGPVGFGIHAPPGMEEFNPIFSGPAAAFESFDHLISSPASIGTTRTNDVGQLFFGERESIKLAFATTADPMLLTGGWTAEASGLNNSPELAQPLSLATLAVPNSIARGLNADKEFYVDVAAVAGAIDLKSGHSENDYYTFFGRAGESVTIEVMSMSLDRYTIGGVDGYIDSTVRLYRIDDQGQRILVPYFDSTAVNDDEFESTDSLLMDVKLPSDAMYIIEVDTFTRAARSTDPLGTDLANLSVEARAALEDVLNDQDTGRYELFVYRFADASAKDRTDYLEGRLGQDIIDGGPGDLGEVQFVNLPNSIELSEGSTLDQWIEFFESRGESWTIAVDFGDGSNPIGPTSALPHTPISVTHNYATDGNYSLTVTVTNNYGLIGTHVINVVVANEPPTWAGIQTDSAAIFEGQTVTLSGSFVDPGTSDAHTISIMWGDSNTPTLIELAPGTDRFTVSHLYVDDNDTDTYSILLRVVDEDGSFDDDQTSITVNNVAPTAVISLPVTINEGLSATVSLTSPVDPSSVDAASLRYSFARSSAGLAADYSAAGNSTESTFTFVDNGVYTVFARLIDKDGGFTDYQTTITVNNVAPTAVISLPVTINEGSSATVSLTSPVDPSSVDAASLRYSFALSSAGLAADYSAAGNSTVSTFTFVDNGVYNVFARLIDKDGGFTDYQTTITVNNVAPTALISSPVTINEGSSATVSLTSPVDPSSVDAASLRYSFALSSAGLAADYSAAGNSTESTFTFVDNGVYTVFARLIDKDGGFTDYQTTITVNNVAPTAVISSPVTINEGSSATVSLSSPVDPSSVDTASLRYSFALSAAGLANDYSVAGSSTGSTFNFADNGTYTVFARVIDKDGGCTDYQTTITVNNVAPTAIFSATANVTIGNVTVLSFSSPVEPSSTDLAAGLRYSFALSQAGLATTYSAASTTASGSLQMLTAGVITVWGRIFDKDGGTSDTSAQVVVSGSTNNLPPAVSIQTGDSGIKGITSTFLLTATDQDAGDAAGPFTYQIQWGDGTNSTVVGGKSISVSKTYSAVSVSGSFTISATAADARGAISQSASAAFSVLGWSILPDPLDPSDTVLVIVGSPHDDDIKVKEEDEHCDTLKVSIRDKEEHVRVRGFVTGDIDTILVFGLAGDDKISIEDDVELTIYVWGGAGDDRIKGGDGNDVLLGEQGNDTLFGGKGRDLLIGGSGSDRIHGEDNDDILIAGYTIYDLNRQALDAIMAEWTSPRDYSSRRLNLMGVSNPSYGSRRNGNIFLKFSASSAAAAANDTVFDDGVQDSLWGDDARDWFLGNLDGDHSSAKDLIKDRGSNESSDDIDRWF